MLFLVGIVFGKCSQKIVKLIVFYKEITPSTFATSLYLAITAALLGKFTVTETLVYLPFLDCFELITAPVLSKTAVIWFTFSLEVGTMNLKR